MTEHETQQKLIKIGTKSGKTIRVPVQINGDETHAIIDIGAEVTVLSEDCEEQKFSVFWR